MKNLKIYLNTFKISENTTFPIILGKNLLIINRVCIDLDIRIGFWYRISYKHNYVSKIVKQEKMLDRPDLKTLAFDIETTKLPLKFPDRETDHVMMISLMYEGLAVLITNRDIISKDIEPFDYAPRADVEARVEIFNEKNEKDTIYRFF